MRLTPNIGKKFSYLFGIIALENNTEHLTSFLKIFRSPTDLASKNIKNEPENVIKSIYYIQGADDK